MGAMPRRLTNTFKFSYKPNWCSQGLLASGVGPGGAVGSLFALGAKAEYGWINNSSHSQTQASAVSRYPGILIPKDAGALSGVLNANTIHQVPSYCLYNGHDDYVDQKFAGTVANQVICSCNCYC